MSAPLIVEGTIVSIRINGNLVNYTWTDFTSQLTQYSCPGGICATAIGTEQSVDIHWLIFAAVLVFFMQAGFTFLELGSVHLKNSKNIMAKNMTEACVGAVLWYLYGYGVAFVGGNSFSGNAGFLMQGDQFITDSVPGKTYNGKSYANWFFQWAFASTAATIPSGALAERITFHGYILCVIFVNTIYPFIAHWGWSSTGWASNTKISKLFGVGIIDFSGSGIIHFTGGLVALIGIVILGPRKERFDSNGHPKDLPRQSIAFQTLGTLILWFGWYGFNCGSVGTLGLRLSDVAAKTAVTTTLSAAVGGCSTLIWGKIFYNVIDPGLLNNGILSGLVAVTAGCSVVEPETAILIGFIASIIYTCASKLLLRLHIDDVLDAVPVHMCNGAWGLIAASLFATEKNVKMAFGDSGNDTSCGLFFSCNGNGIDQFGANIVFLLAILAFVGSTSILFFGTLHYFGHLRVNADIEENGLDESHHGGKDHHLSHFSKYNQVTDFRTPIDVQEPLDYSHYRISIGSTDTK